MITPGSGRLIAAEFVGTTIVMLAGPGLLVIDPQIGRLELALGFGLATAIAIGVIGAVANPMFSLALWFAKSISNGYPMGAVVGKREVMEPAAHMFISSTYWSDTIGLRAALTTRLRGEPRSESRRAEGVIM